MAILFTTQQIKIPRIVSFVHVFVGGKNPWSVRFAFRHSVSKNSCSVGIESRLVGSPHEFKLPKPTSILFKKLTLLFLPWFDKKIFVGTCWWNFRYYYLYILRPSHCTWKLYCSFFNLFFIHFNSVFKSIGMNNVSRNHIGRTLMVYSTRVPTQNPLCKHSVWVFLYMSVISDSNSNRFLPWTQFFVLSWIKNESNKYHNA